MLPPNLSQPTLHKNSTVRKTVKKFVEKRAVLGFGLSVAVLLVIGILSYENLTRYQKARIEVERTQEVIKTTQVLLSQLKDAETGQRGYLLTGDKTYLQPYKSAIATIYQEIAELSNLITDENQKQNLNTLKPLIQAKLAELQQTIILKDTQGEQAALKLVKSSQGKQLMEKIRSTIAQMEAKQVQLLQQRSQAEQNYLSRIAVFTIPGCLLVALISGINVLWLDISLKHRQELLKETQEHLTQLQGLTEASLQINSLVPTEAVLKVITEQARSIIGAHQSVTSITVDHNWAQSISYISLSDKYAQWRDYKEKSDGSGIYSCVCHSNRPMRMTQTELESHPRWLGYGKEAGKHPPMRGWLAAPLTTRDGKNIGLIQLSDKYEGEFTEEDEAMVVQLAQMASIAIENTRLYEAEQIARTQAESANRLKDQFLAVLSHELRTPLNPILGWSQMLRKGNLDQATSDRGLETIQRNAKLQIQLIEDLLDVSRIIQGKLKLDVENVDLKQVIQSAVETVNLAAKAKSIQIHTIFEPNTIAVLGDSTRLQQVMWNLLSNAVKFTPNGGRVEVKLSHDSQALIQVSDTGKGIEPEFLPHVFEYFRQADSTSTRNFGGLGLGLAIVRHIVELHGGTIIAASEGEEQGATFTVALPMVDSQIKPEPVASVNSHSLAGIKTLVVDDQQDTLDLLSLLLEEEGASVTCASSARQALVAFTTDKPDILISDIGMPEQNGYTLLYKVRQKNQEIPAIALTAYADETNHQEIMAAGFQKHLTKPLEPNQLIEAIADLVKHKR
jgi:signal transduction histidine kinase/CHASE3 domain sensor protein